MFETFCKEILGPLSLRVALGGVCVYHGFLKIMAGGGTAWYPAWPVSCQVGAAWVEFAAGLAILLGFRCRLAAGLVLALTAVTFAVWQGWNALRLPLHAVEPTLLLLLVGVALVCQGSGSFSVDNRTGARTARG